MFFPYHTDAPIYYLPIMTVVMIVVNVLAFSLEIAYPDQIEGLMLEVGNGLHPFQWLTNNFLHADFMHLIGNMINLWAFGLVVEGKLGHIKTLLVYLGIGILYGVTVQLISLNFPPTHCLGASAVIFGFMAMSLIWAPENSMDCVLLIYFRPFFFELKIKILVGIFVAFQILIVVLTGGQISSEFLHTIGAAIGFAVGIWMLKTDQVDCEYWDIFSVWAGKHLMTDVQRRKMEENQPEVKHQKAEQLRKRLAMMQEEFQIALQHQTPLPAYMIAQRLAQEFPQDKISEKEMLILIQLLMEQKHWKESIAAMRDYLTHYTWKITLVRLNLANILITQKQPRTALNVLTKIDPTFLETAQLRLFHTLREKAQETIQKMDAEGVYELADQIE